MAELATVEARLGLSGLNWNILYEDETWTNWGECIPARAQVAEGEWLTVFIGKDDGREHGMEIQCGKTVDQLPGDDMPVNG